MINQVKYKCLQELITGLINRMKLKFNIFITFIIISVFCYIINADISVDINYGINQLFLYNYAQRGTDVIAIKGINDILESPFTGFSINLPISNRFNLETGFLYEQDELEFNVAKDLFSSYNQDIIRINREMIHIPILLKYVFLKISKIDVWLNGGIELLKIVGVSSNDSILSKNYIFSTLEGADMFVSYGVGMNIRLNKSMSLPLEVRFSENLDTVKYADIYYEQTDIYKIMMILIGIEYKFK